MCHNQYAVTLREHAVLLPPRNDNLIMCNGRARVRVRAVRSPVA